MLMHPHVVQFKEVFLTPKYLAIAMEFVPGGKKRAFFVSFFFLLHPLFFRPALTLFFISLPSLLHQNPTLSLHPGDMFEYVVRKGGLKESEARWFFQQLIVGVDYLHRMGVASRDIKLENTLLDGSPRPLLKICDFGYSKHEKFQSAPGSRVGTPAYLAPEVIMTTKGQTYDGKVRRRGKRVGRDREEKKKKGWKKKKKTHVTFFSLIFHLSLNTQVADIWSCGVMLYVMMVGAYPFERPEDKADAQKLQKMIQRILKVEYQFPPHVRASSDLRDLLSKILVPDPSKRITIAEIQSHPWYLKDLPPGVAEMNDNLPTVPGPGVQSAEEIAAVVREAQAPPEAAAGWADDEFIDSTMDQEAGLGGVGGGVGGVGGGAEGSLGGGDGGIGGSGGGGGAGDGYEEF